MFRMNTPFGNLCDVNWLVGVCPDGRILQDIVEVNRKHIDNGTETNVVSTKAGIMCVTTSNIFANFAETQNLLLRQVQYFMSPEDVNPPL